MCSLVFFFLQQTNAEMIYPKPISYGTAQVHEEEDGQSKRQFTGENVILDLTHCKKQSTCNMAAESFNCQLTWVSQRKLGELPSWIHYLHKMGDFLELCKKKLKRNIQVK